MSNEADNPAKVDWARYLPKEPLPDTGPKEFKVGQVWACYAPGDVGGGDLAYGPLVYRISDETDWPTILAGARKGLQTCITGKGYGSCSVLLQDVNDPSPRPVEEVYGAKLAMDMGDPDSERTVEQLVEVSPGGKTRVISEKVIAPTPRLAKVGETWERGGHRVRLIAEGTRCQGHEHNIVRDADGAFWCPAGMAERWTQVHAQPTPQPPTGKAHAEMCACEGLIADGTHSEQLCEPRQQSPAKGYVGRPRPEGMSAFDIHLAVSEPVLVRRDRPRGTSEADLEELANPWKRGRRV